MKKITYISLIAVIIFSLCSCSSVNNKSDSENKSTSITHDQLVELFDENQKGIYDLIYPDIKEMCDNLEEDYTPGLYEPYCLVLIDMDNDKIPEVFIGRSVGTNGYSKFKMYMLDKVNPVNIEFSSFVSDEEINQMTGKLFDGGKAIDNGEYFLTYEALGSAVEPCLHIYKIQKTNGKFNIELTICSDYDSKPDYKSFEEGKEIIKQYSENAVAVPYAQVAIDDDESVNEKIEGCFDEYLSQLEW